MKSILPLCLLLLGLLELTGCALSQPPITKCTSDQECRDALSVGAICGHDGFCRSCEAQAMHRALWQWKCLQREHKLATGLLRACRIHPRCDNETTQAFFDNLEQHKQSFLLGDIFDHSEDNGDQANLAAIELVFEELENRQPLAEGAHFARVSCSYENDEDNSIDGLSETEAVESVTRYLSSELNIPLIIGPAGSDDCIAAYNAANQSSVLISPSCSAAVLATIDGEEKSDSNPGLFWRTVGPDTAQASVMAAAIVNSLSPQATLAVIYQNSVYGAGFKESVYDEIRQLSPDINLSLYKFERADTAERQLAWESVAALEPDGILYLSSDILDITGFITFLDENPSPNPAPIFLADGAADEDLLLVNVDEQVLDRIIGRKPALNELDLHCLRITAPAKGL